MQVSRNIALGVIAALAIACGGSDPGFVPPAPETAPDDAVEAFITRGDLPAVAVAVIDDGKTLYTKVAGVRKRSDPTRVKSDDAFHIGSCTKGMTALLAGTVVDEHLLTWDSTVGEVLAGTIAVAAPYRAVTLAQLLSHTSGLPVDLADTVLATFSSDPTPAAVAKERRRMAELALALPPASTPGTTYLYSGLGYVVAGLMLEVVTGKSWETLMAERLFAPLGMAHAGFGPPATPGMVDGPWGHGDSPDTREGTLADNPPASGPGGTVHASLGDLIAYARFYLDGGIGPQGRILSDAALKEIETPRLEHYGFGWFVGRDDNGVLVMVHTGSNNYFWSAIVLYPERHGAIVTLTNAGSDVAWERGHELTDYLAAHFGLPPKRPWAK